MVHLGEVSPAIWDVTTEYMEDILADIDFSGEDILPDWRKSANSRKLERELFQKYGLFKEFILDPKFQFVKHFFEENSNFNLFVGDPLLPTYTVVILLFMLHKRVSSSILGLVAVFLFSINPFYVCIITVLFWWVGSWRRPRQYLNKTRIAQTQSIPAMSCSFDHVLIGNDIGTLYTAALLAQNGHSCCVLQQADGQKLEVSFSTFQLSIYITLNVIFVQIFPNGAPCCTPLYDFSIGKIERYQVSIVFLNFIITTTY